MNKLKSKGLNRLNASDIVAGIQSREFTCEDVTRACLAHIEEREPQVQAWKFLDPIYAIEQAKIRDKGKLDLPMIGVPFNVKDIIDTASMPTEYGSCIFENHRPAVDAACVALTLNAGGILLGKATTTEFANFFPSPTRNPLDLARTPGGSSSGSAASVADNMVPVSIGTQTSGSIARPASYCGIFGYRPTYGDFRSFGTMECAASLDSLGLLGRSVSDIALFRDVLLGVKHHPLETVRRPPRIAFCRTHLWDIVESNSQTLLEDAAKRLSLAGADVFDLTLPERFIRIPEAHRLISGFEFARNHTWAITHHWSKISKRLREGRIADGLGCSYEEYVEALNFVKDCQGFMHSLMQNFDIVLTAIATGEAPLGLDSTGNPKLALIWTTCHLPSISIPSLTGPNGMPIGIYLVGKPHQDRTMLAISQWVYQTLMKDANTTH